jgi:hypothetical protein
MGLHPISSPATLELKSESKIALTANINRVLLTQELNKGLNKVGLSLSPTELTLLSSGYPVSLENRQLGEIGCVFILAAAISAANLGKKNITFKDLPSVDGYHNLSGLPLYYLNCNCVNKYCLYLILLKSRPTLILGEIIESSTFEA